MESLLPQLAQLRFRRSGPSEFVRPPFTLRMRERWTSLTMGGPLPDGIGQLGTAGLWVRMGDAGDAGDAGDQVAIADLPIAPGGKPLYAGGEALPETALIAAIEWLITTARDEPRPVWEPPCLEDVQTWLEPEGLTIQGRCSNHLRQAEVKHAPGVFTLRVALVAGAPQELDARRQAWRNALLVGACRQWHMVRTGMSMEGTRTAVAEIDLSGAPHGLIERLVRTGMASLRSAVAHVVPPIQYVCDPTQPCRFLRLLSPFTQEVSHDRRNA